MWNKSNTEMSKQYRFGDMKLCKIIAEGIIGLSKNGAWWAATFDHLLLGVGDWNLNLPDTANVMIDVLGAGTRSGVKDWKENIS